MEKFSDNTNLEIYNDLEKHRWFRKVFPNIDSFDYRNYDSGKKYFEYQKLKRQINDDFVIYKKNVLSKVKRFLWFIFWILAIYKLFSLSFLADYLLFIFVLSGYLYIYKTGAWENKSLKINKDGCEINETIIIKWNEISNFITIPYLMNEESNYILYAYIVTNNGILYKINFFDFTFGSRIKKRFLPVYVEYFREKSESHG